jgi:hypothetical protein
MISPMLSLNEKRGGSPSPLEETRTFRLCTRAARDAAVAGMAVCIVAAAVFAALLLYKSLARPRTLGWLDVALPGAAAACFSVLRISIGSCLTIGPAGLLRGRGEARTVLPWSSVEAVELHALPRKGALSGPGRTEEPWLLIRLRGARSITVRGDVDGFHDLVQMLRRHVPPERWHDRRAASGQSSV